MPTSCMTASFFYFISLSYNLLTLIYNSFLSQVYCKVSALAGREYAGQEQYQEEHETFDYKETASATTGLGDLLKGLKL